MSQTFTQPWWGDVEVSGASGITVLPITDFQVNHISIIPPSEGAVYDVRIKSADGFLMLLSTDITGSYAQQTSFSMYKNGTIEILNASSDGTYAIQVTRENLYG
jgi:hypothetical protein